MSAVPSVPAAPAVSPVAGVDHVTLTVTDLEVSHRFYTEILGFVLILDFGPGRMYVHNPSALVLGLVEPEGALRNRFSELSTGLDHLGLAVTDLADLQAWEERFRDRGVDHTPIREVAFGHHLNFRDPDGIALEMVVAKDVYAAALARVRAGGMADDEIEQLARQMSVHLNT